ncbi:MAG: polysaccharide deacetylase family protein [Gemmatimonadota bacterium]
MRFSIFRLGGTLLLALLLLIGTWRLARSRTLQLFGGIVPRVETSAPVVALTFDDGPTAALTDSIVAILDERGARATFFVIGQDLAGSPESGRTLVEAGHELGNHTYTHERMVLRSQDFIREEIEGTDAAIRRAGQTGAIHFRPPYSYKLAGLPYFLRRSGRTTVTWDIEPDSYEDFAASPESIVQHVLDRVAPGSIILLHPWYASRRTSYEAIPMLVDSLQARGYRVTTVSDLLTYGPREDR